MSSLTQLFTSIADSIRNKKGTSDPIIAENFPSEISSIPTGGGSDYSSIGVAIDVEAETAIDKGDKIIGRLNSEYVEPTRTYEPHNINNILAVSNDLEVVITDGRGAYSANVVGNGYQWVLYFLNTQTGLYGDPYTLTLENYPESYSLANVPVINADGTLAVVGGMLASSGTAEKLLTIVFEIDKTNHSVTYRYVYVPNTRLLPDLSYNYDTYTKIYDRQICGAMNSNGATQQRYGGVIGNKIFMECRLNVFKTEDDSSVITRRSIVVLEYANGAYTIWHYPQLGSEQWNTININSGSYTEFNMANDNTVMFSHLNTYVRKIYKFDMTTKTYTASTNLLASTFYYFSDNYKYSAYATKQATNKWTIDLYETNYSDLSVTKIKSYAFTGISPSNSVTATTTTKCSNDGRYIMVVAGYILDMVDEVSYGWASGNNEIVITPKFDVAEFITKTNIGSLVPSTEAEYIVREYTSTSRTANDVLFGVASQDLAVGIRGQARLLNKMQNKAVTITQAGTTVISADSNFDSLNSVTASFSSDYNVKADMSISTSLNTLAGHITSIGSLDFTGITSMYNFFGDMLNLQSIELFDTSSVTSMDKAFYNNQNLLSVPQLDMSHVLSASLMFQYCYSLVDVPTFNWSSMRTIGNIFQDCRSLSNDSLNNILASLSTITYAYITKTLSGIGLSQTQAETCTTLSNWQALSNAGWTTGY